MSVNLQDWHEKNSYYLSVSVDWLRLKLNRLAATVTDKNDITPEASKDEEAINKAFAVIRELESVEPLPALVILKRRFGLYDFEQYLLLLCAAMELNTWMPSLCARAQDDLNKPYPTFALAMSLFKDAAWDTISSQRPLRYWRLIEINQLMGQPLISCPLKGDERIINFIKGLNYLDERIVRLSSPFDAIAGENDLPPSQEQIVNEVLGNLKQPQRKQFPTSVQLIGVDPISKQLVAQKIATGLNLNLINLSVELLPSQPSEVEELAKLWQRENLLLPIAGYLDMQKADSVVKTEGGHPTSGSFLQRIVSLSQGIFFISTREVRADMYATSRIVEVNKPTPPEQQTEWTNLLGEKANGSPALLAGQFNLNVTTIREIVQRVTETGMVTHDLHKGLWKGCLSQTSPELDMLVQKLDLKSTWDDIVLPEASLKQLMQIANQVKFRSIVYDNWGFRKKMNRGLGINALFVGESGTGKTMAAEVLANELNLHLYRIDLSGVVSKYIGETEKNLRRVFDAAEDGGAILFFDEADALFGKRSEVKDSHDRYANIEVNYLLQRMESYGGLAILATNKKNALDEAFTRRLRFIINFPFPGTKERRAIVQKSFPSSVPTSGLDYDRLATLNLTGGSFYNIAINAAFHAAEKGSAVTMPIVLSAAKAEFQKMERPVKESDFIWNGAE
jgi:hypothetical protein